MSYNHDNVIDKLLKLNERIAVDVDDVQNSGLVPNKEEFTMANLMWKKYNGGVEPTDENMWKLVDSMLTQENPSKIGAIKIYRRFVDSTLREAKEMVDAREIKIQKGW